MGCEVGSYVCCRLVGILKDVGRYSMECTTNEGTRKVESFRLAVATMTVVSNEPEGSCVAWTARAIGSDDGEGCETAGAPRVADLEETDNCRVA